MFRFQYETPETTVGAEDECFVSLAAPTMIDLQGRAALLISTLQQLLPAPVMAAPAPSVGIAWAGAVAASPAATAEPAPPAAATAETFAAPDAAPAPAAAAEELKRGRGRPKKDAATAAADPAGIKALIDEVDAEIAAQTEPAPAPAAPAAKPAPPATEIPLTMMEIADLLNEHSDRFGAETTRGMIKAHGADRLNKLSEDQRQALAKALKAELAA